MLNFCYGRYNLKYCYHWLMHLSALEVAGLIILTFIVLFILLRIFAAIFKDFNIW